ncbi:MAG: hypothetical protein ABIV48_00070 [Pyrinomonadaceae bacterium]
MNIIKTAFLLALTLIVFNTAATAQRKKTPTKPKAVPAAVVSVFEIRDGADKVAVQIKNVTKFLYTLGGIAIRIEDLDNEAKARTLSRASLDLNSENKQNVMQAIRNLRAGIAALEVEFRTKPALTKFLVQIQGITDLTAQTEYLAAAGKFSESGKPLLLLVEKLSDTLAAMP